MGKAEGLWLAGIAGVAALAVWLSGAMIFGLDRLKTPEAERLNLARLTLIGVDGRPVPLQSLLGRPFAITFGFTHCPDVCPTTLLDMARWRTALADAAGTDTDARDGVAIPRFLFVTVDPNRDTPEALGAYLAHFDDGIIALTGTPQSIDAARALFGVRAERVADGGAAGLIDHTAGVQVVDATGRRRFVIAYGEADERALAKLRAVSMASEPAAAGAASGG